MELKQEECIELIIKKLCSLGVSMQDSKEVADVLMEAELRNDSSHGIKCLLKIANSIKKGQIIPNKRPDIIHEDKAIAIIDGENVLGPVAGIKAVAHAIKKAKEYGIAAVSIRKSHHLLTMGYYAKLAALNNMIGIIATSTAPAIFAPGGLEKVLGTNPIAIGIPSKETPIVLDMSPTKVARGELMEAIKRREKIPLDWALDKEGNPTDDPNKALEGSLRTIGEHKGFGLSLAIDILSAILSGSASGKEISGTSMHLETEKTAFKGDLVIVIDISKFLDLDFFKLRVSNLIRDIKNSKRKEGVTEIHIPGETVYRNKDKIIDIDNDIYDKILEL